MAEFDALAEGCVGGNSIHVEELEGTHAENDCDRLGEALLRSLQQATDAGIQRNLPAEDAHDQCGRQVTVFGRKSVCFVGVQEFVAMSLALPYQQQNLEGSHAGGGYLGAGLRGR